MAFLLSTGQASAGDKTPMSESMVWYAAM